MMNLIVQLNDGEQENNIASKAAICHNIFELYKGDLYRLYKRNRFEQRSIWKSGFSLNSISFGGLSFLLFLRTLGAIPFASRFRGQSDTAKVKPFDWAVQIIATDHFTFSRERGAEQSVNSLSE